MAFLFLICILYNSKFSLTSKCLGTNAIFVKRVLCTQKQADLSCGMSKHHKSCHTNSCFPNCSHITNKNRTLLLAWTELFNCAIIYRQDKHEILLEEMRRKDQELEEMREFTELERECEKETISALTEVRSGLEVIFFFMLNSVVGI